MIGDPCGRGPLEFAHREAAAAVGADQRECRRSVVHAQSHSLLVQLPAAL